MLGLGERNPGEGEEKEDGEYGFVHVQMCKCAHVHMVDNKVKMRLNLRNKTAFVNHI